MKLEAKDRLIVALDVHKKKQAIELVDKLSSLVSTFKVGAELFTGCGPSIVEEIQKKGNKVFLDLKYHDIPNTVKMAMEVASDLGVHMVNVHASVGFDSMKAVVETLRDRDHKPLLMAVTILTSMDEVNLREDLGIMRTMQEEVVRLAIRVKDAGFDGVICSPKEIMVLRGACGRDFHILVSGIRPAWSVSRDDQKRVLTPSEAIELGANYLVVGRPIRLAEDPVEATNKILEEIKHH